MKNLDYMKKDIISQIEKMDAEKFEDFLNLMSGEYSMGDRASDVISLDNMFNCENCKMKYGDCTVNDSEDAPDLCMERFIQFAEQEME